MSEDLLRWYTDALHVMEVERDKARAEVTELRRDFDAGFNAVRAQRDVAEQQLAEPREAKLVRVATQLALATALSYQDAMDLMLHATGIFDERDALRRKVTAVEFTCCHLWHNAYRNKSDVSPDQVLLRVDVRAALEVS